MRALKFYSKIETEKMTSISVQGNTTLPTLYEYYTAGGIKSGLNADQSYFTLNGINISLYSGAMHYFRTPKQLWRDRLRKMRAAGLNAVETYVPWNLHEPTPGQFDFGHGGTDMEDFLDIESFLKTAQEEDLLAILRPGPYICAEWEFGGMPSWLLREKNIKFRTNDEKYMGPVKRFFNALLPILFALQFINGGPIISFQIENEYASTQTDSFITDKEYLKSLRQIYLENNISSLLTTADGVAKFRDKGTIPELFLVTANFGADPITSFDTLESIQPGRPKMAMEYYPGWFDHWSESHQTRSITDLFNNLKQILSYPGSFNIYMFHGGTNFGFFNGANLGNDLTDNSGFQPDTTSYDYDGPLTEAADYSVKYQVIKNFLELAMQPKTKLPKLPELTTRKAFANLPLSSYISLKDFIDAQDSKLLYQNPTAMELININNGSGQSFGYITYRKENVCLRANASLLIEGHVFDSVLVLVNGKQISPSLKTKEDLNNFGFYRTKDSQIVLTDINLDNATVDLVVENWGRVNYGHLTQYYQFKGIWQGNILIDKEVVESWQHIPLEFKKSWIADLQGWKKISLSSKAPGIYKAHLNITTLTDTYIDMRPWTKGIVIVNRFVLGRYARIGPQQCLYWPAPLMKQGMNEIIIFEHFEASDEIHFSTDQIWETL